MASNKSSTGANSKADASSRYPVPDGFRPMLEALAREVLRHQPNDIYAFSALFFDTLLHIRQAHPDASPLDDSQCYAQLKQSLFEEAKRRGLLTHDRSGGGRQQQLATPTHQQQDRVGNSGGIKKSQSRDDIAATKIQAAFRGYRVRHDPSRFGLTSMKRNKSSEILNAPHPAKETRSGSMHNIVDDDKAPTGTPTAAKAATKIQSEVRGYLQRKHYEQMKTDLQQAATKIQAQYRGYMTRKKLGLISPSSSRSSGSRQQLRTPDSDKDFNVGVSHHEIEATN